MAVITVDCVMYLCDTCQQFSALTPVDGHKPLSWSDDHQARHRCPHCTAAQELP